MYVLENVVYFSPYNNARRNYFKTLPPQVRNALRKQYEKYMQQVKITIHFFHSFSSLGNLLKEWQY